MTEIDIINKLKVIFSTEKDLLDKILQTQSEIHLNVKNRKWNELQDNLEDMDQYSKAFVDMDNLRDNLVSENNKKEIYFSPEIAPLFTEVRTRLTKSKIENEALSKYVSTTQGFITGVLEQCIPQQRNTLYTRSGRVVKPAAHSVVLDALS